MRKSSALSYRDALLNEIRSYSARDAATIFLGGGTPNTYDLADLALIFGALNERFNANKTVREVTIEVNPELVAPDDFRAYVQMGVTRVSIGVQSFVASEIATLGRKHTPEQVERAVVAAREAGVSVSLDLIFAVPGQTLASWEHSVRAAIDLDVDHISTYGLTVEEGTPYFGWREREPNAFLGDDMEAELYARGIELLSSAGFMHYEISNFGKPGHTSRHNANYWANGEYVGVGVGAASYVNGERSVHTRDLSTYVEAASAGRAIPSESERLDPLAAVGEAIMLALRTSQGVNLIAFKERYGVDILDRYRPVIAQYADAGLLEIDEDSARLSYRGKFLANDVCGAFVTFK